MAQIPLARNFVTSIVTELERLTQFYPQLSSIRVIELNQPWSSLGEKTIFEFNFTPNGERSQITVAVVLSKDQMNSDLVLNYFSEEERFKMRTRKTKSVNDLFQSQLSTVQRPPQELYSLLYSDPNITQIRATKISIATAIYTYFGSKYVFDPNIEYGSRLIGASLVGVEAYHGIDNNNFTYPQNLLRVLKSQSTKFNNYHIANSTTPVTIADVAYDTVFTNLPSFDDDPANFGVEDSARAAAETPWAYKVTYPMLKSAIQALAPGGHLLIYYNNPNQTKYMKPYHQFLAGTPPMMNMKFLGIIGVTQEDDLTRAQPIFVYRK